jgi:hypothetical protein
MPSKIEDSLQAYKTEVEGFIRKSSAIDQREREDCQKYGLNYRGRQHWSQEDSSWLDKTTALLEGMAKNLDLSRDQDQEIWRAVSKKLVTG